MHELAQFELPEVVAGYEVESLRGGGEEDIVA